MPIYPTWVRYQDDYGQFDLLKGSEVPPGATPVEGYPEYEGPTARNPKPKVAKDGRGYDGEKVGELRAEASRRGIDDEGTKPELVDRLEKADDASLPGFPPDEAIHPEITDTGTEPTSDSGSNDDQAGNASQESE